MFQMFVIELFSLFHKNITTTYIDFYENPTNKSTDHHRFEIIWTMSDLKCFETFLNYNTIKCSELGWKVKWTRIEPNNCFNVRTYKLRVFSSWFCINIFHQLFGVSSKVSKAKAKEIHFANKNKKYFKAKSITVTNISFFIWQENHVL